MATQQTGTKTIKVFLSYAHEDNTLLKELRKHLRCWNGRELSLFGTTVILVRARSGGQLLVLILIQPT